MKVLVSFLLLLLLPLRAEAGELALTDATTIVYPEVAGLCRVEPDGSAGEKAVASLAQSIFLTAAPPLVLIDCAYIEQLRRGKRDGAHVTQILALTALPRDGKVEPEHQSRRDYVAALGDLLQRGSDGDPDLLQQIAGRVGDSSALGAINGETYAAIRFDRDDSAALLIGLVPRSQPVPIAVGVTLLKGIAVATILIRPSADPAALDPLLAEVHDTVGTLIALNDPEGAAPPGSLYWLGISWDRMPGLWALPLVAAMEAGGGT